MSTSRKMSALVVAIGRELGLGLGDALRAKAAQTDAASKAKASKAAVNEAIKHGATENVAWPEGNKRTNAMAKAVAESLGDISGISDRTKDNYLATAKWCYVNKVVLQTWDLDAQKKKEQKCAMTGAVVELDGCGAGDDAHCVKGFVAMQEKQEGFEAWVSLVCFRLKITDPLIVTEALWQAMADLGHAEKSESGEWKAK